MNWIYQDSGVSYTPLERLGTQKHASHSYLVLDSTKPLQSLHHHQHKSPSLSEPTTTNTYQQSRNNHYITGDDQKPLNQSARPPHDPRVETTTYDESTRISELSFTFLTINKG